LGRYKISVVRVRVYDLLGEHHRLEKKISTSRNPWVGCKNEAGEQVSSGIYFYTIQAGDFIATRKMVVAK
jgi:5-hydroxyisourate hydrolase-like protein (transthyretin family)